MGFSSSLYDKSPRLVQEFLVNLYGLKTYVERYGKEYRNHMLFLSKIENFTRNQLLELQNIEFMKLFYFAKQHSEFYKRIYSGIEIKSIAEIDKLPIVTKDMLRRDVGSVYTISRKFVEGHTGGTTGMSLVVRYTMQDMQRRMAVLDHFRLLHGFKKGMRRATFSGKHLIPPKDKKKVFWRHNYFLNQRLYSTFDINEDQLSLYIENLNKFKPKVIDGFVTSIYDIASFLFRHGLKMEFRPIAIFPTSETVTAEKRQLIEKVFKCNVRDQYASSEGAPFITECTEGHLHYRLDTGVIENIAGTDEIAVTSFTTYGTPLIRYAIGDSVRFAPLEQKCRCGSSHPIVEEILGRKDDYLLATNGAKINLGNISNAFKNIPNAVINSQIIQEERDKLTVKIVVDEKRYKREYDELIIKEFKAKFGSDMKISLEKVKEIEKAPSGKYVFVKREL